LQVRILILLGREVALPLRSEDSSLRGVGFIIDNNFNQAIFKLILALPFFCILDGCIRNEMPFNFNGDINSYLYGFWSNYEAIMKAKICILAINL
jgi:hypothetical protein